MADPYVPFHADWKDYPDTTTPITAAFLEYLEAGLVEAISRKIVDAKGDMIVATTADVVARKAVGVNNSALIADSAQGDGLKWAYPPGYEFDVASVTANVTITATAEGSQSTVIAGNAVTYDGSTAVLIEFFCPRLTLETGATTVAVFGVYEDSTLLCRIAVVVNNGETTGNLGVPVYGRLRRTPSAASHTYTIKAHSTAGTAVCNAGSGSGGSGTNAPILLRVVKAA